MLFLILGLCLFRLIFFCFVLVLRLGLGWSRLVLGLFCIWFLGRFLLVCLSFCFLLFLNYFFSILSLSFLVDRSKKVIYYFFSLPHLRKCNSLAFVTFSKTVPTELQKLVNYFFELLYLFGTIAFLLYNFFCIFSMFCIFFSFLVKI